MSETRNVPPKSADFNILDDGSVLKRARDSGCADEEVSMERLLYACTVSPFQGEIGNNILSIVFPFLASRFFIQDDFSFGNVVRDYGAQLTREKLPIKLPFFLAPPEPGQLFLGYRR
jgi:hypothetical protein